MANLHKYLNLNPKMDKDSLKNIWSQYEYFWIIDGADIQSKIINRSKRQYQHWYLCQHCSNCHQT